MDDNCVINVENVSKEYKLYNRNFDRIKETFHPLRRKYHHKFKALDDVSFHVKKGDTVGIIGCNGSGKSTLLQLVCGIIQPTSGNVEVKGRISALLELGAGFNPEFTGRQNVYINSAILGLSGKEIEERFDDIVDFADIGEFLDQPVKTYSSGMYVRLAFAVAINVYPEILVVDEALAVGDTAFQYKCLRYFDKLQKSGTTILFVTHDVSAIKKFCTRGIWINDGQFIADSDSVSVADQYQDFIRKKSQLFFEKKNKSTQNLPVSGDTIGRLLEARMYNSQGEETSEFITGDELHIEIQYEIYIDFPEGVIIGAAINRTDNVYVCGVNTGLDGFDAPATRGINHVTLKYKNLPLLSGTYNLAMGLFDMSGIIIWDIDGLAKEFRISSPYKAEGIVVMDHSWGK